jgi:hypothetical protein
MLIMLFYLCQMYTPLLFFVFFSFEILSKYIWVHKKSRAESFLWILYKKCIFKMDLLLEINFENIKETRSFCTCLHLFTIK